MENNQISDILTIILVFLVVILFILLTVFIILLVKKQKSNKPKKEYTPKEVQVKKNESSYNKQSIFYFMEFEKIEDNMIISKNGNKYIMAIECQGINYDLMSGLEKNSVEQGFLQFLNTLRHPIQLYIQTRTVNLESSILTYKQKVSKIRDEYIRRQMNYNSIVNMQSASSKEVQNARIELVKLENLYEYGLDIIQNTEKMNFNKNILKKNYYIIISYVPEDVTKTDYDMEEIRNMAFSELYTRAQAIISALSICEVSGKVLNSKELIELLYIAYNRDEAEVYDLEKALNAGFDEIYSTAPNVLEKRMKEIEIEVEREATRKANDAISQAIDNQERTRKLKQKEEEMNDAINLLAKSILEDNEAIIGKKIKEEAEKIVES